MFKNILVPTDGSESSQETIRRAITFAKEIGAGISVVHVRPERRVAYYSDYRESGAGAASLPNQAEQEALDDETAKEILAPAVKLCAEAGVACKPHVKKDNLVYQAIIDAARDYACDLIFMASHGRSGLGAVLLGSETIKVLTHSKIPVLVCR